MNAQNTKPAVKRETKNKIRVEFDRTPLKERLKAKFLSTYFLTNVVWYVFRLCLLIGIAYVVLFPFISMIMSSVMSPSDFIDASVFLIPKDFTLDTYKAVLTELGYWKALGNTFMLSFSCALIQTFICSLIGYGFAKFRFKGNGVLFMLVMLTMIIPHQTLRLSMFMSFRYFDILGIFKFLAGGGITIFGHTILEGAVNLVPETGKLAEIWTVNGLNLCNTYAPLIIMSLTGLAFKNGLYIYMLRQFFTGVPDALEESAYLDGAGTMRTFFQIILPLSVPMMITVFLFAFCWQWTDNFYVGQVFLTSDSAKFLVKIVSVPPSLKKLSGGYAGELDFFSAVYNTCGLVIIAPLVILYMFCQNFLVQGIERSGLTAD